jgi:cytochrome P450
MHRLAVLFTPIHRRKKIARDLIVPVVRARIAAAARGDAVPDDMLQWLIQAAQERHLTMDAVVEMVNFLSLGSLHTTVMVCVPSRDCWLIDFADVEHYRL